MFSYDIVKLFVMHYKNKESIIKISKMLNISRKQLYKWKITYKEFLRNNNREFTKKDYENLRECRLRNKLKRYYERIINYVNENSGCSLIDIHKSIDKEISISSLCRILKELKIVRRRKKMRITNKSKDELIALRKTYMTNRYWNPLDDAVYIDEVHFSLNDLNNYGYTFKGVPISQIIKSKSKVPSVSVLCAMSKDRVFYQIHTESINQDKYIKFIKSIRRFFKLKIFIQDNARIHKGNNVKKYIKKSKIKMEYTPPYSPEFNPIELLFNKIKNSFRKIEHKNIIDEIGDVFKTITQGNLINFINHSEKIIAQYV